MSDQHQFFAAHLPRPIPSVIHPRDPTLTIARVELGLTLYLAEPLAWAHSGAADVLRSFLAVVPPDYVTHFTTSHMPAWRRVADVGFGEVTGLLPLPWHEHRSRHLFEFVLTDDLGCPSCGFRYMETEWTRARRAALIEITLPQEFDARYLLPIARAAAAAGPLWAGVGGYAIRVNEAFKADAHDVAWAWTQRYRGLDIQDTEQLVWEVPKGLPGANWLTIVGASLLARRPDFNPGAVLAGPWIDPDITVETARGNMLVVAGAHPIVGDGNRFEQTPVYAEVGSALRSLFLLNPPPMLGRFRERGETQRWMNRLLGDD